MWYIVKGSIQLKVLINNELRYTLEFNDDEVIKDKIYRVACCFDIEFGRILNIKNSGMYHLGSLDPNIFKYCKSEVILIRRIIEERDVKSALLNIRSSKLYIKVTCIFVAFSRGRYEIYNQ